MFKIKPEFEEKIRKILVKTLIPLVAKSLIPNFDPLVVIGLKRCSQRDDIIFSLGNND